MKALWLCVLLSLLSVGVYGRIAAAPSGEAAVHAEDKATVAAAVQSAYDGQAEIAIYVLLHESRDTAVPLEGARTHVCD